MGLKTIGNQEYQQRLHEFMQSINPKPSLVHIEKIKQELLAKREVRENPLTKSVIEDVNAERVRQESLWGKQRHQMGDWLKILIEEVGEAAQAMQIGDVCYKDSDASDLYTELVQVAAVAVAIAEQVLEESQGDD